MNGERERYWLDTLTDEERERAKRLMDMPIGMAIAFVDRDLRSELRSMKDERTPSKKGITALATTIATAVVLALLEARSKLGG